MEQKNSFHLDPKKDLLNYTNAKRLPLIEICGHKRVLIENHLGIAMYSCQEIMVKVCFGCVQILGSGLVIKKFCKEKIVISGDIDAIRFQR